MDILFRIASCLVLIGICLLFLWLAIRSGKHVYKFKERTVRAYYLEEARRELDDYHSPLIETDDKCVI